MKIVKTPSGSLRTVVVVGKDAVTGKRIIKTVTARSRSELRIKVADLTEKYKDAADSSDSFKNAALAFMRDRQPVVSPNTYTEYDSRYRTLSAVFPEFCEMKAYDIATADVQGVLNALLKPHKGVYKRANAKLEKEHEMNGCSVKTVRNYWHFINSVLKYKGISIKPPQLPQKVRPDIYVPSDEEMKTIIRNAEGELSICIRLAAFGPMREGEVCALSLDDINGNVVHVHRDIVYEKGGGYSVKSTPKTSASNRYIEFPEGLIAEIRAQGYVTNYNPKELRSRFQKLLKASGIRTFRFHDLRHYGVSTLHAQGIPDAYIMKRGGWSTDSTLKAVYRHTLADQDKLMTEKAILHFDSLV